jgi:hypothetical protein
MNMILFREGLLWCGKFVVGEVEGAGWDETGTSSPINKRD